LTHRYHELKHGGILLVNMLGHRGENDAVVRWGRSIYRMFEGFVREGLMSEQQLLNYSWPHYFRSIDEILEPIKNQVNGIQFRVLNPDVNSILVPRTNPIYAAYRDVHHDTRLFAQQMTGFCKAAGYNVQRQACDNNAEQSDRIWQRLEEEIAEEPDEWECTLTWANLILQKL
jgi:hypothetical protein